MVDVILQNSVLLLDSSENDVSFHVLIDLCPLIHLFYIKMQYLSVGTANYPHGSEFLLRSSYLLR